MKLETNRLIIRSLRKSDVESLAALWTDPNVTYYMGGSRNYEEVLKNLSEDARRSQQPSFDLWPVINKATGKIIGHCGIIDKEVEGKTEYEIVYVLAKSAWGKGLATEAAISIRDYAINKLGLKRIVALIDPDNQRSEIIAKKIGLTYEKDTVRPGGKIMRIFALNV